MILTGKAKKKFGIWHFERNTPIEEYENFHFLSYTCKNALIVEFFDSVGITVDVLPILGPPIKWQPNTFWLEKELSMSDNEKFEYYQSRLDAQEIAIKYANEILNQRL
jgi:hypothetical protein